MAVRVAGRRLAAALMVAALVASALPARPAEEAQGARRQRLREHLNWERSLKGLPPLRPHPALDEAAQARAEGLARRAAGPGTERSSAAGPGLGEHLAAFGYEAETAEMVVIRGAGTVGGALFDLLVRGAPVERSLFGDLPDLGIGIVAIDQIPVFLLVFARSMAEGFARRTANLADIEAVRDELLEHVNEARRLRRRGPLKADPCLERVAQRYAESMLEEGFFDHTTADGSGVFDRVREAGCRFLQAGENLAEGPEDAGQAVSSWLDSESHRQVLLTRDFDAIGFGLAYGRGPSGYRIFWVQVVGRRQ